MPSKPETNYISSIHRRLPHGLHREKMANPYRGGTADVWYSGNVADLWVEYKYVERLPVRASLIADLSELQKDWLRCRYIEGRSVAVIVGCKEGGIIMTSPEEWENPLPPNECRERLVHRDEIARWIHNRTIHDPAP
jgi:hypothetical protein